MELPGDRPVDTAAGAPVSGLVWEPAARQSPRGWVRRPVVLDPWAPGARPRRGCEPNRPAVAAGGDTGMPGEAAQRLSDPSGAVSGTGRTGRATGLPKRVRERLRPTKSRASGPAERQP